jgi:hypothetical protein
MIKASTGREMANDQRVERVGALKWPHDDREWIRYIATAYQLPLKVAST